MYPEMEKVLDLCELFSCSMDQLIRQDMVSCDEAYSDIRVEQLEAFQYMRYTVVSMEPEDDAKDHVNNWAINLGIDKPVIIGWDFPVLSQEQINVHNMHGYTAALVLKKEYIPPHSYSQIIHQEKQQYIAITIKQPSLAPFRLIPNAYKTLLTYMKANKISQKKSTETISCFEKEYCIDGIDYMDVYIAIDN